MGTRKVLFVDDEENILSSIRRGLIDEDYDCLFALNGIDALEIIKNNSISVIVTDMRMPKMDGLTLLKEVKKISPTTVRIVLSGYTQLQQILATINQVDIFKFITKPWKLEEEFKVVIEQALQYYTLVMESENLKKALENKNAAYKNMLKNIEDRIASAKNESNIIKQTSKVIFEHLFKIIDNEMNEDKTKLNYEFERDFCKFYSQNITSEIEELNVVNLLDNFTSSLIDYNKQLKVKEDLKFPENYKIKTNKIIVDCFMKYIIMSIINSNNSYTMNIYGDIKYNLDKEIIEFIFDIVDLKNQKVPSDNDIHFIDGDKIDFVSTFMNEYLKVYNGAFKIKKIDDRLIIKIELIKDAN
ncbi:hypothetical protein psyc5s11_11500 [Clostridium gelidum]|uniref:Stage 0 sporulation protein A homolog n=1 Tax=Clostridium gelidum TaxID=704125 RepID=A0ABN6IW01_9CLOT|nr:response regulator [Clostridium gelidum]BCZ45083.1 hypothetical protein psyc5s11_11500 [Clostridium gelidum]